MIFENYIESLLNKAFCWGINDCYTFAYNYLELKYPNNKLKDIRGLYSSNREALIFAQKYKWSEELNKNFKIKKINIKDLKNNDLVLIKQLGFECIHIYQDNFLYSISRLKGLIKFPLNDLLNFKDVEILQIQGKL